MLHRLRRGESADSRSAAAARALRGGGGAPPAVLAISWSCARPCVLAAACGSGAVAVYDLYASAAAPAVTLGARGEYGGGGATDGAVAGADAASAAAAGAGAAAGASTAATATAMPASAPSAATALAFNPRARRLLAAGDGAGRIRVWKLGWRLGNAQPLEARALALFAAAASVGDDDERSAHYGAGGGGGAAPALARHEADDANSLASFLAAVARKAL